MQETGNYPNIHQYETDSKKYGQSTTDYYDTLKIKLKATLLLLLQ